MKPATFWSGLRRALFPARSTCWLCQGPADGGGLCPHCRQEIDRWKRIYYPCHRCGRLQVEKRSWCPDCAWHMPPFRQARAVGPYTGDLRRAIGRLKYRGEAWLAAEAAELMAQVVAEGNLGAEVVVPVPLHARRQHERSYNQAELLGRELARLLGLQVDPRALVKVRATAPQVGLTRVERLENLRDAFAPGPQAQFVAGGAVLLVDDVLTTGATARQCSLALLAAGAREVNVVTLATAVISKRGE